MSAFGQDRPLGYMRGMCLPYLERLRCIACAFFCILSAELDRDLERRGEKNGSILHGKTPAHQLDG